MTHCVRIVHRPKRSHHKKAAPEKARVNLARPWKPIAFEVKVPLVVWRTTPPESMFEAVLHEANRMVEAGWTDAARLGLCFLREYRMAHKFWECV